jgi:hypothetical protein
VRAAWLVCGALAAATACSSKSAWVATGAHAAFPSPLAVDKATAITIDATYIYWITGDGFLYRAPRASGEIDRLPLPAPGTRLGAHNDVFVGWTDGSGNAAIADIDPPTGTVTAQSHLTGALVGMVAGQHGYAFAAAAPDGTDVLTCLQGVCPALPEIKSGFKSLALDLPTKTFYVLTTDGLRTCTVSGGCPTGAEAMPAATTLIAALPGTYFLVDANGQAFARGGTTKLGEAAVPSPDKLMVVDGNGHTPSPVGTWSNGTQIAQTLLAPAAKTTTIAMACTDFDVDATGRPIYCLVGSSSIRVIP